MRISDWSSDVCSSDLHAAAAIQQRDAGVGQRLAVLEAQNVPQPGRAQRQRDDANDLALTGMQGQGGNQCRLLAGARKRVVSGKSVSGRVDLGVRRIM